MCRTGAAGKGNVARPSTESREAASYNRMEALIKELWRMACEHLQHTPEMDQGVLVTGDWLTTAEASQLQGVPQWDRTILLFTSLSPSLVVHVPPLRLCQSQLRFRPRK